MAVTRMDNVGIVVEDLDAAIAFFQELGLVLEGRAPIQGDWADGVTGLPGMRVEIAMLRTPDGHSRVELSRFLAPLAQKRTERDGGQGRVCVRTLGMSWQLLFHIDLDSYPAFKVTSGGYPTLATTRAF